MQNIFENIDISKLSLYLDYLWESITIEMFIKFIILYFFIIWIAILVWVVKDINNRTNNILLQVVSILTILVLTPLWVFIYLLIRPGRTLFERYYDEIEENLDTFSAIIEENTRSLQEWNHCQSCEHPVSPDFKFCPNCKESLRASCRWCQKDILITWKVCAYCGKKQKKQKKDGKKKNTDS